MTEYLLYVSLVFIPIACWIAYLLNQDGFDIKTTILVLVMSYLMITAFPFSVQHLGAGVTILVYSAIFAVLILVMSKPELFNLIGQSDELSSEMAGNSLTVPGGETTVFTVNSAAGKTQQREVPLAAGDITISKPKQTGMPEEILPMEAVSLAAVDLLAEPVPAHNAPEDRGGAVTSDNCITDQELDSASEQVIPGEERPAVVIADTLSRQPKPDEEPSYLHYLEDRCGQSDITQVDVLLTDYDSSSLSESVIIDVVPDHQAAGSKGSPEQQAIVRADYADAPTVVDDCREAQDNLSQDIIVFSDTAVAGDGWEPDDQAELVDWIERGFEAKAQEDLPGAAQNFTRALQVSTDDELKYLLGMELVTILQNTGDYEQAEIVLDDLIQTISAQPAMIMELRQQKQYISLLSDELKRLGLEGTPIFEVPRFVRMKLNDKMLA